jgi:hypothetical protein
MVRGTYIFSFWCIIKAANATVHVDCEDSHRNTYVIDPEDISLESDQTSEGKSIIKLPTGERTLRISCGVSVSSDSSSDPNPDNNKTRKNEIRFTARKQPKNKKQPRSKK